MDKDACAKIIKSTTKETATRSVRSLKNAPNSKSLSMEGAYSKTPLKSSSAPNMLSQTQTRLPVPVKKAMNPLKILALSCVLSSVVVHLMGFALVSMDTS